MVCRCHGWQALRISAVWLIEGIAKDHDALLVDPGAPAPGLVLPDAVHLTARGQARLAWLAAPELQRAGLVVADGALSDALAPLSRSARVRYALRQGASAQLRDWRRRAFEEARRRWVEGRP